MPTRLFRACGSILVLTLLACNGFAQQSTSGPAPASTAVPNLINFNGTLPDALGKLTSVTFLLYKDQTGGAPLWMETQNVNAGKTGHYTVTLGSTTSAGLPEDLFASGEARWLGVQVQGQPEQARVLLVAVPYALKSRDAETLGGLPASAFMIAAPAASVSTSEVPPSGINGSVPPPPGTITGTGAAGFLPGFTAATTLGNSAVFQVGASPTAKIGINTKTPAAALDVKGTATVRGVLALPPTAASTAAAGTNSQAFNLIASAFNKTTSTATNEVFAWRAEPTGNNTPAPKANLALLFGQGATAPAETGLKISNKGVIAFAAGQTFPGTGTGNGTVTSIGLSAPTSDFTVSGSPVTGAGTLNFAWNVAPTSTNTPNAIVKRDATGSISVGSVIAAAISTATLSSSQSLTANDVKTTTLETGFITSGPTTISSNQSRALAVSTSYSNGEAIFGQATSTEGTSTGIQGYILSGNQGSTGLLGFSAANAGTATGVYGYAVSPSATGVVGRKDGGSDAGFDHGYSAGVWGDSGGGVGMLGTADNSNAVIAVNNSSTGYTTAFFQNESTNPAAYTLYTNSTAFGGFCSVDVKGNLACSGSKSAVVPVDGGKRKVALYAVESPQNWFEDFGSAQLVDGVALVHLDPDFIQTVNAEVDYKVFPVPNGDCRGLYVANKTATSFEVRELGGGTSSVSFDYRVTALRRNYEAIRFADHTNDPAPYLRPKKLKK
jgi:hypothetical protein